MTELIKNPVLYVLMRTDMHSMNAGKGMAQACHAANQMVHGISDKTLLAAWQKQGKGFGTTIVLDAGSIENIHNIIENCFQAGSNDCGTVKDTSYPIRDGSVTHLLPVDTCGYVFADRDARFVKDYLSILPLHR